MGYAIPRLWCAYLRGGSPRYEEWRAILGGDEVELADPYERRATLEKPDVPVYLLSVKRLSEEQRRRLARFVAEKCGVREEEVRGQFEANGHFPIREEDVTLVFSMRAFV